MELPKTLPFDKFVDLIETMFESNPLIVVGTTQGIIKSASELDIEDSMLCHNLFSKGCTITSIEVRLPQFSIGDTVMIVDTGEIGEIKYIFEEENAVRIDNKNYIEGLRGSYSIFDASKHNIVKIPTDLFPLLQK